MFKVALICSDEGLLSVPTCERPCDVPCGENVYVN